MTQSMPTEPISWLLLERYALGELPPAEAARVERAIESDAETRECFGRIRQPVTLKPLPEVFGAKVLPFASVKRIVTSPWTMAALAAAAVAVLYVAGQPADGDRIFPPARVRTKGGDMALELVRNRDGAIAMNPSSYAPGDRFKVLFTCPPGSVNRVRLIVVQNGEVTAPLGGPEPVVCGNSVPLPRAFALTGTEPTTVCVAWGGAAGAFDSVRDKPAEALRDAAVCTVLRPER